MKRFLSIRSAKFGRLNFHLTQKFLLSFILLMIFSGFIASAQTIPVVSVRFANPHFDCPTKNYCVDVEFMSDTPDQQVYGVNVRFFYDDALLEFLTMGDFMTGYANVDVPQITTGQPGSGAPFGITGPLEWFNGTLQLISFDTVVYLSTTEWTKLFNLCFHVDDPNALDIDEFCPPLIWDLQVNPDDGGYLPGDDGVVITVVDPTFTQESLPTSENVIQFNWEYGGTGGVYGHPLNTVCVTTKCGYIIPLANWSLYLAIGMMIIASVVIYRRRIS